MKNREVYKKILAHRAKKNEGLMHASIEMQVSTHMPMLLEYMAKSEGTIAELGGGLFSTPLLHWANFHNGRKVISYESYKHYYKFEKEFESETHKVVFVPDWKELKLEDHYGLVFIDHTIPSRKHTRGEDAIRFKDIADYVILHDAGKDSNPKYGYEEAYKHFKYRRDWDHIYPHTTVLSNFHPL